MGHVQDRWTRPGEGGKRTRTDRWGKGQRWQARWVEADGRRRIQGADSKAEAQALLAQINVDTQRGTYISPTRSAETFQAYAERWRSQQLHHRPGTAESARARLEQLVYPVIGHRALGDIRRSDIQALIAAAAKPTSARPAYAPATIAVTYAYLSAVFKAAVDDRAIGTTPCVRINLPPVERAPITPLTLEQVETIAERVQPRWRALVHLAAHTGMRSAELRGLTVDRISPPLHTDVPTVGNAIVFVDRQVVGRTPEGLPVFGPPKTPASTRRIPIGPSTVALLVDHLRVHGVGPGGLVFHTRQAGPLSRPRAGEVWRSATAGMDLRDRSGWHDLRHFHASLLISSGMSVRAVADRLGHQDAAETLRTYAHMWPGDDQRAVAAVEAAWAVRGAP